MQANFRTHLLSVCTLLLEESINRALKDKYNRLSRPTAESIVDSGKSVGAAQLKLRSIENDSLSLYRQEWQALIDRIESSLRKQLDQVYEMGEGA